VDTVQYNLNVAQSLLREIGQARSDSKALTDKLYRVSQRRASIRSFGPPSWTCASAFFSSYLGTSRPQLLFFFPMDGSVPQRDLYRVHALECLEEGARLSRIANLAACSIDLQCGGLFSPIRARMMIAAPHISGRFGSMTSPLVKFSGAKAGLTREARVEIVIVHFGKSPPAPRSSTAERPPSSGAGAPNATGAAHAVKPEGGFAPLRFALMVTAPLFRGPL